MFIDNVTDNDSAPYIPNRVEWDPVQTNAINIYTLAYIGVEYVAIFVFGPLIYRTLAKAVNDSVANTYQQHAHRLNQ